MATINLPTISAGTTAADDVNDALYGSETTSMQAINGHLGSANLSGTITSEHIREQALANGKAVAATGTLDCPSAGYAGDEDAAIAPKPVPGSSLEFYLPYDASVVIFTWNIGAGNSILYTAGVPIQISLYIDGAKETGSFRTIPGNRVGTNALTGQMMEDQDFRYSGHVMRTDLTKGFHSASLRLFVGTGTEAGNLVRLRVRDMKVIWFK